jgi:hypothetical protein
VTVVERLIEDDPLSLPDGDCEGVKEPDPGPNAVGEALAEREPVADGVSELGPALDALVVDGASEFEGVTVGGMALGARGGVSEGVREGDVEAELVSDGDADGVSLLDAVDASEAAAEALGAPEAVVKIVVDLGDVDAVPSALRVTDGVSELERVDDAVGDPLGVIELVEDGGIRIETVEDIVGLDVGEDDGEEEAVSAGAIGTHAVASLGAIARTTPYAASAL